MHNASHHQEQVKVAVISAQVSSDEAQHQQLQAQIALAVIGLSALAMLWIA